MFTVSWLVALECYGVVLGHCVETFCKAKLQTWGGGGGDPKDFARFT